MAEEWAIMAVTASASWTVTGRVLVRRGSNDLTCRADDGGIFFCIACDACIDVFVAESGESDKGVTYLF